MTESKTHLSPEARKVRGEYNKQYHDTWAKRNPDKIREYQREWRRKNPDKIREYHRRHWEKKAAEKSAIDADLAEILERTLQEGEYEE